MGAFDAELNLLGFRSPAPVKPKKKKITHNFYGPLTCYITSVSRGGSCSTDGYIIGISKKDIAQANKDSESFQEIYKNFKKHGKSYAFIDNYTFQAIKLENLDRKYR